MFFGSKYYRFEVKFRSSIARVAYDIDIGITDSVYHSVGILFTCAGCVA